MAKDNFYRRLQQQIANRKGNGGHLRLPLILLVVFVLALAIVALARQALITPNNSAPDITADISQPPAEVAPRQFDGTAPYPDLENTNAAFSGALPNEPTITPIPQAVQMQPTITPLPEPVQVAQPPGPGDGLVGPEWTVASRGDINQDGKPDVVAFKWATFPVGSPIWQRSQTSYPAHSLASHEIVIVQQSDDGNPQILLSTSPSAINAQNATLMSYPGGSVAGYLLQTSQGATVPISLIPINADFSGFQGEVGIYWDPALQQFRLFAGGQL